MVIGMYILWFTVNRNIDLIATCMSFRTGRVRGTEPRTVDHPTPTRSPLLQHAVSVVVALGLGKPYVVEILDPCPQTVHHVGSLLVTLRVGVQVTVVAKRRAELVTRLLMQYIMADMYTELTSHRSSEPSVQSGRPRMKSETQHVC